MRRVALFAFALASAGCERGCLMRWVDEQAHGTEPVSSAGAGPGFDLSGIDCSDGLLRCRGGNVEASRVGHLPSSCAEANKRRNPEKTGPSCACPWEIVTACRTGCADERVEATAPASAARQLCRPAIPVARPVLPADDASVDVCSDEGVTCREGIVRACDGVAAVARPLARCLFGCAADMILEPEGDGPPVNPDGWIAILCRRSDAERSE